MPSITFVFAMIILICGSGPLFAEDFYLDSPYNKGTLRFEINNDTIWDEDSNFSNGWSLQYHTVRYASWDDTRQPGFIKWVGNHFPTLGDDGSIVRNSHSIGQNMVTPGDIEADIPPPGDLPYAGTATYTLNWQRFNRKTASNFQISMGVLGAESLAEQFQKFVHTDLGLGEDPSGWDTQRDSEPILNLGYKYTFLLADFGQTTNRWGGQFEMAPSISLGNLFTAVDVGLGFRFGWNRLEGFTTASAPPGRGFFQDSLLPKPKEASPHSIDVFLGGRGSALIYSVLYDGSFITDDDRDVDRETFVVVGGLGLNYSYLRFFAVRFLIQASTDLIKDVPPPPTPGADETTTNVAFGSLIFDFYF